MSGIAIRHLVWTSMQVLSDQNFHVGFNRIYDVSLALSLRRIFKRHARLFEGVSGEYKPEQAATCWSIREFDDAITRVSFGWPSVDAYYAGWLALSSRNCKPVHTMRVQCSFLSDKLQSYSDVSACPVWLLRLPKHMGTTLSPHLTGQVCACPCFRGRTWGKKGSYILPSRGQLLSERTVEMSVGMSIALTAGASSSRVISGVTIPLLCLQVYPKLVLLASSC